MDCSKTEVYFAEKKRMCDSFLHCTEECPLFIEKDGLTLCDIEVLYPKEALAVVQKWSDEHKLKTILDDFREKYPEAPICEENGYPLVCPHELGYSSFLSHCDDCGLCWDRPLENEGVKNI